MIEVKGRTAPVVFIRIKEKGSVEELIKEVREKLNNKIFEGSIVVIENPEVLTEEERKRLEDTIRKRSFNFERKGESKRLLIVNKTLRAGQRVEHSGDILVLGDVNRDAEIVAGGNVIVMGKLRGIARAGLIGDEEAVIVALIMEPQMIQIGKKIATLQDEERNSPGYPEIAKLEGGQIILEPIEGVERWQKLS
ncbi:septum site-determining protein MinC [Aquifex pyrophilus]